MTLITEKRGDDTAMIAGRLYAARVPAARQILDSLDGVATLDCTSLEYISSAGFTLLMETQKRLSKDGGTLRLAGASRHLRDLLQFSGLETLFELTGAGK